MEGRNGVMFDPNLWNGTCRICDGPDAEEAAEEDAEESTMGTAWEDMSGDPSSLAFLLT